jgi:hypothetical protein
MTPSQEGGDNRTKEGFLVPSQQLLRTNGKVLYNESAQAHNILKINKTVLNKYPQLREKSSSFRYDMIVPETHEEMLQFIQEIKKGRLIPICLFFEKVSE